MCTLRNEKSVIAKWKICNFRPISFRKVQLTHIGPLHMSPVDRASSVTEMKLVSVHMVTFSPLSEMKNLKSGDATIQA